MNDFAGTELEVGQDVALCLPYYKHLVKGKVEKIGDKMATCSYQQYGREQRTPRYPEQIMVIK